VRRGEVLTHGDRELVREVAVLVRMVVLILPVLARREGTRCGGDVVPVADLDDTRVFHTAIINAADQRRQHRLIGDALKVVTVLTDGETEVHAVLGVVAGGAVDELDLALCLVIPGGRVGGHFTFPVGSGFGRENRIPLVALELIGRRLNRRLHFVDTCFAHSM